MSAQNLRIFSFALLLLVFSGTAASQDGCRPFGGTLYGWHDGKAWAGEGDFMIGGETLHAKVVDVNTGIEKHDAFWWGTETATFDFGEGNKLELLTEFTTEHMKDAGGVFHVNENGTFANGTRRFRKASGHFNSQGPFGPGVRIPAGKANPPAGVAMYWIGQYDGIICGIGK